MGSVYGPLSDGRTHIKSEAYSVVILSQTKLNSIKLSYLGQKTNLEEFERKRKLLPGMLSCLPIILKIAGTIAIAEKYYPTFKSSVNTKSKDSST